MLLRTVVRREIDIDRLTGLAIGSIGMSMRDYMEMTPEEFVMVAENWWESRERVLREDWEQTRLLGTLMLQPYTKKALRPRDVIAFEWERDRDGCVDKATERELTTDEIKARYRGILAKRKVQNPVSASPRK